MFYSDNKEQCILCNGSGKIVCECIEFSGQLQNCPVCSGEGERICPLCSDNVEY
ncbi:hypothetical protein [Clostridium sp.]|uniref:hypothetical protein n=1 Tax=Clostridium sp. TaxID=1506 RepID=UPI002FC7A64E